jgi:ceramide glucosyltransferase
VSIFLILAILLALQSAWSLVDGYRFLALVHGSRQRTPGDYQPFVAVIVPAKGLDPGFEANLTAFLTQDYPAYQLILAVAADDDPAYRALAERLKQLPAARGDRTVSTALVVAGRSEVRGEKVNNLLAGLKAVDPAAQIFVFADLDATPSADWLRSLVAPLSDPSVTVSTGFRWYLPGHGFASRLRAAWDTSIATMLGEHGHNFAWGGSMAIRAADFNRLEVAERNWASTVSDDYALTRAVRQAHARHAAGRIRFEPRCLVKSREESSLLEFFAWANRQIILTRVYSPRLWWMGLGSYLLYCATFVLGLALIVMRSTTLAGRGDAAAALIIILALGIVKARLRTIVAREVFPEEHATLDPYGSCYWTLAPLVPWVMLVNFVTAGLTRRIEWRGVRYELRSPDEIRVLK